MTTGVAAHITAADVNGPRFDPALTGDERRHISNGIWLCHSCSDLVDKDWESYPVEQLQDWKRTAEQHARELVEGKRPDSPTAATNINATGGDTYVVRADAGGIATFGQRGNNIVNVNTPKLALIENPPHYDKIPNGRWRLVIAAASTNGMMLTNTGIRVRFPEPFVGARADYRVANPQFGGMVLNHGWKELGADPDNKGYVAIAHQLDAGNAIGLEFEFDEQPTRCDSLELFP